MLSSSNRSVFDIHIRQPLRLLTPGFVNRGKFAVARGPILYAVDSCPEAGTLTILLFRFPLNSRSALWCLLRKMAGQHSGRRPIGPNIIFPSLIGRTSRKVFRRPGWFCVPSFRRAGKNLSYAQHTEAEPTPYDLSEPLTEFRVLFPVFFI